MLRSLAFRSALSIVVVASALRLGAQTPIVAAPDPAATALEREDAAAGRRARLWSLGSTLIPLAAMVASMDENSDPNVGVVMLGAAAIYVGPAMGYWIEGEASRGWAGVGIRFGSAMAGGMIAGLVMGDGRAEPGPGETSIASAAMLGAFGGIVWSAVHDIRHVDDHVRRVRARSRQRTASLTVAPVLNPSTLVAGFRVALAF
jgi:hypothetical protein